MKLMERITQLQQEVFEWSNKTFGVRDHRGPLGHLELEIGEIYESEGTDLEEWADVLLLFLTGAKNVGFTIEQITERAEDKLEHNRGRKWGPLNEKGFSEHIREGDPIP